MSWSEHWRDVKSSVVSGDVISGCRDNDTRTYRLFVNKGWRDVGSGAGYTIDSCSCCDLSIEDIKSLADELKRVISAHEPWPEGEE